MISVAVVAPQYPPDLLSSHADGVVTYFQQMVRGYRDAGADVSVITFGSSETRHERGEAGERILRIRRAPTGSGIARSRAGEVLRSEVVLGHALRRLTRRGHIDLVEIPDWLTPAVAPMFANRLFMKLHGPADFIRTLNGEQPSPVQRILDRRARYWARRVDVIHAGSSVLAEYAREQWGLSRRIPVMRDPWAGTATGATSDSPVPFEDGLIELVSIGRLEWRKGQHVLLQAMNELPADSRGERWRLTLVGRDTNSAPGGTSYRAYCEGIMSARTAARVRWVDGVPITALAAVHRRADVTVVCSLDGNYGYTSIQALCDGACLVTTLEPGLTTSPYVTHGVSGMLVESGDVAALMRTLHYLIRYPDLRRRLRRGAVQVRELVRPSRIASTVLAEAGVL